MRRFGSMSSYRVDPSRCVHFRHASASCRRCEQVCSAQAVEWHSRQPWINPSRCSECGACAAQCPAAAVLDPPAPKQVPVSLAEHCSGQALRTVCCSECDAEQEHATAIACLARLDLLALFELAQSSPGPIELVRAQCRDCRCTGTPQLLHDTLVQLQALTQVLGKGAAVSVRVQPQAVLRSRRRLLGGWLADADAETVSPPEQPCTDYYCYPGQTQDRRALPAGQTQLVELLRAARQGQTAAEWPEPLVRAFCTVAKIDAQRCSGCCLCGAVCPTGALSAVRQPAGVALTQQAGTCIGCGLCVDVCYKNAVQLDRSSVQQVLSACEQTVYRSEPQQEQSADQLEEKLQALFTKAPIYRT